MKKINSRNDDTETTPLNCEAELDLIKAVFWGEPYFEDRIDNYRIYNDADEISKTEVFLLHCIADLRAELKIVKEEIKKLRKEVK